MCKFRVVRVLLVLFKFWYENQYENQYENLWSCGKCAVKKVEVCGSVIILILQVKRIGSWSGRGPSVLLLSSTALPTSTYGSKS